MPFAGVYALNGFLKFASHCGGGLWNILHDFFDFAMKDRAEHLDCVGTYAFIPLHTGYLAWTHIEFMNQRILSYPFMTHGFP